MFCGIGPDENPPLRIAYSAQFLVTLRTSKFGPSLYSRVRTLVDEPCVPATDERVAPAAALREQLRGGHVALGHVDPGEPHAAAAAVSASTDP